MLLNSRRQTVAHPAALAEMWRDESGSRRMPGPRQAFQQPQSPSHGQPRSQGHQNIQLCCGGIK
jgi:hypothetical protein